MIPQVSRFSWRLFKNKMNYLYVFYFMGLTKMLLLSESYSKKDFLPLLYVMGFFPVRSVVICLLGLRILVNIALVWWGISSNVFPLLVCWYCCFVDLIFLLACCILPFAVTNYGRRCFLISYIVKRYTPGSSANKN